MININTQLLDQVTPDELYLLSRLANRINKDRTCFPGGARLMAECGWSKSKLQRIKKSLYAKGLLSAQIRKTDSTFTCNLYTLETPMISKYSGISTNEPSSTINEPTLGSPMILGISPDNHTPISAHELGVGSPVEHKVLSTEGINQSEVLESEVLEKEKKKLLFEEGLVYKCLIDCLYPSFEKYADYYLGFHDFAEHLQGTIETSTEPTTKTLLKKIWAAAEKLIQAFKELNRPRLEFGDMTITRGTRKAEARSEAEAQIKAYTDYCRISGRYSTTDPDKIPETLIRCDWVIKLHEMIKVDIDRDKYDPARDGDLQSQWLLDMYYYQSVNVYVCKRYNNRIMYEGEEYLKVEASPENLANNGINSLNGKHHVQAMVGH